MISTKYASLFVVAGMNLSGFAPQGPIHWNESSAGSRMPASSVRSADLRELAKGKEVRFTSESDNYSSRTKSDVVARQETIAAEGEQAARTLYIADVTTEANCTKKGCKASTQTSTTVEAESFEELRSLMNKAIQDNEEKTTEELNQKVALAKAVESCLKDESGEKLEKEDRLQCRMDRMADLDEEEQEKYFNKYLKKDLEAMAMSSDPAQRKLALEKIAELKDGSDLSSSIVASLDVMKQGSATMAKLALLKSQIAQANMLPDGDPMKAQIQSQVSATIEALNADKAQLTRAAIMDPNSTKATEALAYYESHINSDIMALQAQVTPAKTTTNTQTQNSGNTIIIARGAIQDPQASAASVTGLPSNLASSVVIPNATNNGGFIRPLTATLNYGDGRLVNSAAVVNPNQNYDANNPTANNNNILPMPN